MPAKFVLFKDKGGKFRFNLKAGNGEIIASSESYPDKKSAQKGIASVVKSAAAAADKIEDTTVEAADPKAAAKPKAAKAKAPAKAKAAAKPKVAKAKAPAKPKV